MRIRLLGTLLAVVLLATGNVLVNRVLPGWAYPVSNTAVAVILVVLALWAGRSTGGFGAADIGLRIDVRRSLLFGGIGVVVTVALFTVAALVPSLRIAFQDDRIIHNGLEGMLWAALVRIPFGTVLLEEIAFRGVLPALLGGGRRWHWPAVLGSAALFGLWHLLPSLALTGNAAVRAAFGDTPQVVISALAMLAAAAVGVLLSALRHAGRGVLAPILVHLATNSGGVLFAWLIAHPTS